MGKWTLQRVTSRSSELRRADRIGTNFHVMFHMQYAPSRMGRFEEPPKLDWSEQITMLEHHEGKWWNFNANMYAHNPTSQTLLTWPRRYIAAYETAAGAPTLRYGSSKLFDNNNRPVTLAALGRGKASKADKANAVRSYLKSHGGRLVVEIHDTPAIVFRPGQHKERLLRFDCGLVGSPLRARGEQYLKVDSSVQGRPPAVIARFTNAPQGAIRTGGLARSAPPAMVSMPRNGVLTAGEYA